LLSNGGSSLTGDGKPKFFYGYIVVAAALLIVIIAHGAQYTFGIFFKPILTDKSSDLGCLLPLFGAMGFFRYLGRQAE